MNNLNRCFSFAALAVALCFAAGCGPQETEHERFLKRKLYYETHLDEIPAKRAQCLKLPSSAQALDVDCAATNSLHALGPDKPPQVVEAEQRAENKRKQQFGASQLPPLQPVK